ncbi:syntaxin Pep12p [Trichomonascus vanleenenianus]|uniref:syntaxin Pep12p n=1 Tax=Trichomonascus vanleenenianus TaxID=2268995 RepID=UPI003EC9F6CA
MSFQAGPGIEAQNGANKYEDFDVLCTAVTDELYELSNSINVLQKLVSKVGTARSNKSVEERLARVTVEATTKFQSLGRDVKQLADWEPKQLSRTQRFTQTKLEKEFGGLLNEFRTIQKSAVEKQRLIQQQHANQLFIHEEEAASSAAAASERTPLLPPTQQQLYVEPAQAQSRAAALNQSDIDFQTAMIEERETEIQDIERGIREINSIFQDLGALVAEQGTQIDTVENNITSLASNTEQASRQLRKADEYQRKRRNWSCCVLTVLITVLTVILLALTL